MVEKEQNISKESLLNQFNDRDHRAFAQLYVEIFDEMNHFACRLFYYTTVDPKDLVQDIFVTIWSNKSLKFASMLHIRNYLYIAIKNKYKDYLKHNNHINNYNKIYSEDFYFTSMIESSTLAALSEVISFLPDDSAAIFKLYIEGWSTDEIAQKMNKSTSSIYSKRNSAIMILKKHLTNKQLYIISYFF